MLKDVTDRIIKTISIISIICLLVIASYTAVVFISSRSVSDADRAKVDQIITDAQVAIENHEFVSAIEKIREGLSLDPSEVRLYITMAEIYEIKGDYGRGIEFLTSAPVSVINKIEVERKLGRLYCLNNDSTNCINTVSKFADFSNPQYEEELMIQRLLLDGDVNNVVSLLQPLNSCKSEFEKELVLYKILLAYENISSVRSYINLCSGGEISDEVVEINAYLNKTTEIADSETLRLRTMTEFTNILVEKGFYKSAISIISSHEDQISQYWEPLFLLGISYLETDDRNNADKYISKATEVNPYSYFVWWAEAKLYLEKNDIGNAIDSYKKAIMMAGDNSGAIREEYIALLIDQKMESTVKEQFDVGLIFYSRLQMDEEYIEMAYKASQYQYSRGRTVEASSYLTLLLSKDESIMKDIGLYDDILLLRCEVQVSDRNYDEAERLSKLFEDEAYRLYCEGLIAYVRNETREAKSLFSKAIEKDTKGIVTEKAQKY